MPSPVIVATMARDASIDRSLRDHCTRGRTLFAVMLLPALLAGCGAPFPRGGYHIVHQYTVAEPEFARAMSSLLGPPLLPGNRVVTLVNGDQIFPAMLDAIRAAKHSVNLETYIYSPGRVADEFAEALAERARAGVAVHVLVDWEGALTVDRRSLQVMRDAGVQVEEYNVLAWYRLAWWWNPLRINHRTHRKLLVVDGRIGFTGGAGLADPWLGDAQDPDHWRDNHYRVEGPVVAEMEAAFEDNWLRTRGDVLHGDDYFPPLEVTGSLKTQVFKSSPRGGSESARLMYVMAIAAAQRSIRLASAYFVPDTVSVAALRDARQRGVDVRIIVPGKHIDWKVVREGSRATWGKLLEAGVHIYEYEPTMFHCKVLIVDDAWVSVGSANFDERSFKLNDEANLNVLDRGFAATQIAIFDRDLEHSREITLDAWKRRPLWARIKERGVSLMIRREL
jgi:cardiolipin synthase A/B